mmetsp:Transcript_2332/g.3180  ORF Transcript_2332/g.3180 Transcript_2332/m.3180 type:complete len:205 (+) Transcript_2332:60-674(+)
MPPNRKSNVDLVVDLPTINVSELKLSLPSAAPVKAPQKQQQQDAASYWDWPDESDALIDQIQKDEQIRQLFSAGHIEENLVNESKMRSNKSSSGEETKGEFDDYWNSPAPDHDEEEEAAIEPQQPVSHPISKQNESRVSASYWNYPSVSAEQKEAMIQLVLEEHRARGLTSVEFYETTLVQNLPAAHEQVVQALNAASDSYWDF